MPTNEKSEKPKKKKCYEAENICCDEQGVLGFVAYNSREALEMARNSELGDYCDRPFINTRVRLLKDVNVDDLEIGEMDIIDALKLGVYAYIRNVDCDVCKQYIDEPTRVYWINNKLVCEGREMSEKALNPSI